MLIPNVNILDHEEKAHEVICRLNGNMVICNGWISRAINKETTNSRITTKKLDSVTPEPMQTGKIKPGYKCCSNHTIFDIKMDRKFTRKACLVADSHKTDASSSITY